MPVRHAALILVMNKAKRLWKGRQERSSDNAGAATQSMGNRAFFAPFREILVVGKNDLAFVAVARVKPNVTGVTLAIVKEAKVEVVLGRIDLHPIRKAVEDKGEYDERIIDRQRGGPRDFLDVRLIGLEARQLRGLRCRGAFLRPRPVRELESEQCGSKDKRKLWHQSLHRVAAPTLSLDLSCLAFHSLFALFITGMSAA